MNAETVEGHKGLVAKAERKIADGQSATANAAANAAIAKERIERLKRGENVGSASRSHGKTANHARGWSHGRRHALCHASARRERRIRIRDDAGGNP
jgi:hypothetical protein